MASQGDELVTLGDLLEERGLSDEDDIILNRLKVLAQENLPDGWIKWEASRASREEIFGDKIDAAVLNKITFALPTVGLARAFDPNADHLSEKGYRDIRVKLLDWAFTRALILGPPAIANRIRGSAARTEFFKEAIVPLKPSLHSRKEADKILSGVMSESEGTNRKRRSTSHNSDSSSQPKISRVDRLEEKMENMFSMLIERMDTISRDRATDTSQCYESDEVVSIEGVGDESDSEWQAPPLDYNERAEETSLDELEFKPSVKEADPIIPEPDPGVMAEGIECQRLGSNKWSRIRFKDAEKETCGCAGFQCPCS